MKKNGFTMVELIAIIVIMACILLIVLPSINNTIKNSEEKEKQEALNSIYMAAENYLMANYDDHKIDNVGDTTYINIMDLISNDYMSIDTLNPNNDSTFSNKDVVKVIRNDDGTFSYELDYLKTLIETLLEQYSPDNTTGLLRDSINENLYYYKGTNEQVSNNFLWYGGHQWRVLEFDTEAKTLTLITQQPLTSIQPASTVWSDENSYNSSYVNTWLNEYFWNSLDSNIQNNILDNTFNIGIYTDVDKVITTKKVGLLDDEQYDRSGGENSFLNIGDPWWLGNTYNSILIREVGYGKNGDLVEPSNKFGVRPVIKISDLSGVEGIGTLTSSYMLHEKASNTGDVQVGEYINLSYYGNDNACGNDNICTFRVVSKDTANNRIKVVLNGLLPKTSQWASNASDNIQVTDTIYVNVLNPFLEKINNSYITIGTYGVGMYEKGNNYTMSQSSTIMSSIGLPTIGEMFSGNDVDLSTSTIKIFVDVNTIENPIASTYYWTMNRSSSSTVSVNIDYKGILHGNPSNLYGVRPVIYLKSGTSKLIFTGGKGTAQNPYILE